MPPPASLPAPLRVAVVGAGPSGFYVVQSLLRAPGVDLRVDLLDRLPSPYGLVRYGVAPDHAKIKTVAQAYAKTAADPRIRFYGNVGLGRELPVDDLRRHVHAVVICTGAQTDRHLGIPGEDLGGSHPATEFVAWYNGHPDFADRSFDLRCGRAVVVGVGNVAVDVARILAASPDELARTDISDSALDALRASRIREVWLVGRRGPAQAAFTNAEVEEIGDLAGADAVTLPEEALLDPLSRADLDARPDRLVEAKVAVLRRYAETRPAAKPKRLLLRFLLSPVEILGDRTGRVRGVRFRKNVLVRAEDGSLRAKATEAAEEVEAGLVFRSVGYRGVEIPGVPFEPKAGVIPNAGGRVLAAPGGAPVAGLYAAGWIKRGPSGIIGTNRPDAQETADALLADARAGLLPAPAAPAPEALEATLRGRGVRFVTFPEWQRIDAAEVARGAPQGRPRVKFATVREMLAVLGAPPPR